jgi:hypothetical protein
MKPMTMSCFCGPLVAASPSARKGFHCHHDIAYPQRVVTANGGGLRSVW